MNNQKTVKCLIRLEKAQFCQICYNETRLAQCTVVQKAECTDQILHSANKGCTNTVIRYILCISEINQFVQYLQYTYDV